MKQYPEVWERIIKSTQLKFCKVVAMPVFNCGSETLTENESVRGRETVEVRVLRSVAGFTILTQ
jgi:hypothetical protein